MQESISIELSQQSLDAIRTGRYHHILFLELQANLNKISDLLSAYYFRSRGSINQPEIRSDSLLISPEGKGQFVVHYIIGLFNACADLDLSESDKMTIQMNVDMNTGKTTLTGEYFYEREPDEL